MATDLSGSLPPLGGGSNRPASTAPVGGAGPTHKLDLEPIRIGNLEAETPSSALPKPPAGEPSGGAAPAALQADERQYKRQPVFTGQGAIRCKTFHVKLNDAALVYMDELVNTWLEHHGYEVKSSHMTIGVFQGKTMEQHLIVQVWY